MTKRSRQLHLNAFITNVGHHEAAWRMPDAAPERGTQLEHYVALARIAEAGRLDSIFLADTQSVGHAIAHNSLNPLDPIILASALAARTRRIGLIITVSTTYTEPYDTARKLASLDHLSGGRVGWNIVTSCTPGESANYGHLPVLDHRARYERADEFVRIVTELWDSWDSDALVLDKAAGVYADVDRIHEISHSGARFSVRGPLNVSASPQRWPLLVQAGASADGRAFAARHAEAVFTAHQTIEDAQAFYADLKQRAARVGRDPDQLKILPGLAPIIGASDAEARARQASLDERMVTAYALRQLSNTLEHDITGLPLDDSLPDLESHLPNVQRDRGRAELIVALARREQLTIRELIARLAAARGHFVLAGTPAQIADHMEAWLEAGAADGFNVMPPELPTGLTDFVEQVVPVLQNRGLFRREYAESRLRNRYGVPLRPVKANAPKTARISNGRRAPVVDGGRTR